MIVSVEYSLTCQLNIHYFVTGQSYEIKLKKVGPLSSDRELYRVSISLRKYYVNNIHVLYIS